MCKDMQVHMGEFTAVGCLGLGLRDWRRLGPR